MLLSVRDVTLRFGGIVALDGVSFDVDQSHDAAEPQRDVPHREQHPATILER